MSLILNMQLIFKNSSGNLAFWPLLWAYLVTQLAFENRKSWPLLIFHQKIKKGHKSCFSSLAKPDSHTKRRFKIPRSWPRPRTFWPLAKKATGKVRPFLVFSTRFGLQILKISSEFLGEFFYSYSKLPGRGEYVLQHNIADLIPIIIITYSLNHKIKYLDI